MAKWRILEITKHPYFSNNHYFLVQKRFLGFLWWYDPFEDGLYSDGEFKTLEEAVDCVTANMTKDKVEIVATY